jgi:hypothetical protein
MEKTDFEKDLINVLRSLKTDENVNPSVFFRGNTKVRLMNSISKEKPVTEKGHGFVFFRNPALAFRTVGILIIIFLILSSGTILAAQSVTPKNKLYPVKLESEQILLNITPFSSWKAKLTVEIVKRRANEIDSEKKSGDKPEIKQGLTRYKNSIENAKKFNHENLLRSDEENLNSLTTEYNNSTSEEKIEGGSDSNVNSSGRDIEQQNNTQEIIREEIKTQSSPSDNIERSIRNLIITPSPEKDQ